MAGVETVEVPVQPILGEVLTLESQAMSRTDQMRLGVFRELMRAGHGLVGGVSCLESCARKAVDVADILLAGDED